MDLLVYLGLIYY